MKIHSTNYFNTLVEVAEDCKVDVGTPPPAKATQTVAELQYELIANNPYRYTSDDVLFQVYAIKNNLDQEDYEEARTKFFSKGQPCFRASPLTKSYGYGIHSNADGKIALLPIESSEYQKLVENSTVKKVKAMRSSKK